MGSGTGQRPDYDLRTARAETCGPRNPREENQNVLVQILATHGPRDLLRPQLRPEHQRERSAGAEDALCMEGSRAALLILDQALDPPVLRIQPDQAPQHGGHEQITLDVASAPDEDLEGLFVDDHSDIAVVVTIQDDQTREACRGATPFSKI